MFLNTWGIAVLLNFARSFPYIPLAVHYLIVAIWLGEKSCLQIAHDSFFGYWVFLLIISMGWGFTLHYPLMLKAGALRRVMLCMWKGILSGGIFISWSFIRGMPFACFGRDGNILSYVSGPIAFCVVHLVAFLSTCLLIRKYKKDDIKSYVKMSEAQLLQKDGEDA
jgi:hypothetical protein